MVRRQFLAGLLSLGVALASLPAGAATIEDGAQKFVQALASKAVGMLTAPDIPRAERIKRFRELFNENFAVETIGRWILGRYWRNATPAERAEYMSLFEDLMVVSYVDRFATYSNDRLQITKSIAQNNHSATVYSEIVQPHSTDRIRVAWRVGSKEGLFKIVDVVVEGASMSSTMRSDFGSIVRQRGGDVAGLIEALREKTATLKAAENETK